MKKWEIFFCFLALGLASTGPLMGQKMGFVREGYVLEKMPEFRQIQESMAEYQKKARLKIQEQQEVFLKKVEKFQQEAEQGTSQALLENEAKRLQTERQEIMAYQQALESEYSDSLNKSLRPVYEKFQKAVEAVSGEQGNIYIFRDEALLFEVEENDLSDVVLKKLGLTPTENVPNRGNLKASNKIGYLNVDSVVTRLPEYKEAVKALQTYRQQQEAMLKQQETDLRQAYEKAKELAQSGTASEEAKKKAAQLVQKQELDLQDAAQSADSLYQVKYQEKLSPILKKVEGQVEIVARENNYTFVIRLEASLFEPKEHDLTRLILKKMGVDLAATNEN